jgi:hypothetical protein
LSQNHASGINEALDPKPYIRTFEATLNELNRLKRVTDTELERAAQEVSFIEREHSNNVVSLAGPVEATVSQFNEVDEIISNISAKTAPFSDQLELVSAQHEQARLSSFLIKCYLSFLYNGQSHELVKMWDSGNVADRRRCANLVSQLQRLSRRITDSPNDKCLEEIDKFAENLERVLLTEFDQAYRAADISAMKESADILTDFNGGGSVVQMFVNQHDFFIVQEKLVDMSQMDDMEMWEQMADPESGTPKFEAVTQELVDEISTVTASQTDIVSKVFRNPVMVLKVFLQRIFAQRIQQQLEGFFEYAESASTLAYVRALHICYTKVGSLVKNLKEAFSHDSLDNDGELASLVDQNFADIFLQYIDNGRYFESEKKNLQEIIATALSRFTEAYNQKKVARDQGFLGRFTSSLDNNSKEREQTHEKSEKGRIGQFMRAVRLERTNSNSDRRSTQSTDGEDFNEKDMELQYNLVQRILGSFAESVSRDLELAYPSSINANAQELLRLLIEGVGHGYVDVALDDALASTEDAKNTNPSYLRVLGIANGAVLLMSQFSKSVLISMANGSDLSQTQIAIQLNKYVANVEEKCTTILDKTAETILNRVSMILNKKRRDLTPRDDIPVSNTESPICKEVRALLSELYTVVQDSLDGGNLENFLLEIGMGFRNALMTQLKKHEVNQKGGLNLLRLVGGTLLVKVVQLTTGIYKDTKRQWMSGPFQRCPRRLEFYMKFVACILQSKCGGALEDIILANNRPQVLTSLVREGHLAQMKPYMVHQYLSKRSDYTQIARLMTSSTNLKRQLAPLRPVYSNAVGYYH